MALRDGEAEEEKEQGDRVVLVGGTREGAKRCRVKQGRKGMTGDIDRDRD